jgi:hypothetical protein
MDFFNKSQQRAFGRLVLLGDFKRHKGRRRSSLLAADELVTIQAGTVDQVAEPLPSIRHSHRLSHKSLQLFK